MKDIMEITVCDFCEVPNEFPRPTDFMSYEETVQIYRRWASLCKEDIRNACLLAGLLNEKDSSVQFEQVWQLVWDGIGELGLENTTFEGFAVELGKLIAEGYVEARNAYVQLYIDGMAAAKDIQTTGDLGFDLSKEETTLLTAAQATTEGTKRLGDVETAL
jgi:hypothetical protein